MLLKGHQFSKIFKKINWSLMLGVAQDVLNRLCNRIIYKQAYIRDVQQDVKSILFYLSQQNESLILNIKDSDNFECLMDEISKIPLSHAILKSLTVRSISKFERFISNIPSVYIEGLFLREKGEKKLLRVMQDKNKQLKIVSLNSDVKEVEISILDDFESFELNSTEDQVKIDLKLDGVKAKDLKIWNIQGNPNENIVSLSNSRIGTIHNTENKNLVVNVSKNSFVEEFLILKEKLASVIMDDSECLNVKFSEVDGNFNFNDSCVENISIKSLRESSLVLKNLKGNIGLGISGYYSSLEFTGSEFGNVVFNSMSLKRGEISSTRFMKQAALMGQFTESLIFKRVTFEKAPRFLKDNMCIDVHFIECTFKDFGASSISRYRLLKNKFSEDSNEREESLFSSYELEARAKNTSWTDEPFFKLCSTMYSFFNSYGRSVEKPLLIYGLLIVFFASIYQLFGVDIFFEKYSVTQLRIYWGDFIFQHELIRSFLFSFFNSLGPLRYLINMDFLYIQNFGGKSVVLFHNILASVNLYLIIAGIKKRFKQN